LNAGELNTILTTIFSGIAAVLGGIATVIAVLIKLEQAKRARQDDLNTAVVAQAAHTVEGAPLQMEAAHKAINQKLNVLMTAADLNQQTCDATHAVVADLATKTEDRQSET
jgi:hypothetical protein